MNFVACFKPSVCTTREARKNGRQFCRSLPYNLTFRLWAYAESREKYRLRCGYLLQRISWGPWPDDRPFFLFSSFFSLSPLLISLLYPCSFSGLAPMPFFLLLSLFFILLIVFFLLFLSSHLFPPVFLFSLFLYSSSFFSLPFFLFTLLSLSPFFLFLPFLTFLS